MSESNIYNRLYQEIGNAYGVCGLMGNIKSESAMRSNNLQNSGNRKLVMTDEEYTAAVDSGEYTQFATDSNGYGLCQWTSPGRKMSLLNYSKLLGTSIGDEDMQIGFLLHELSTSYKNVLNVLKAATSVKEASDIVVTKYERPANQSEGVLNARARNGQEFYEKYVKTEVKNIMVKPVDYKQYDSRWGGLPYAVDGEKSTIKTSGCGPTAMADVLAAIVSPYIDPVTTATWARQHGYKALNAGTFYSYIVAQGAEYGVKVKKLNSSSVYGNKNAAVHAQALAELKNGNWLIACMGKGKWTSSGHFIVVYGYENGMVYINDPASTKADRACNTWNLFTSQVKVYWSVEVPEHIKKNGIATDGEYRQQDFVREVQLCIGAGLDGKAGNQTLSRTVTVSRRKNRKHNVVLTLQKKLKKLGLYHDALDKVAGNNFDAALKAYQTWMSKPDGEATARGTTWKKLLGLM